MDKVKHHTKRVVVGIVGGLVLAVGIVAIPYPGPGWLIVFAGLAILATEFKWARKVLDFAKARYDLWHEWLKRQAPFIRALVLIATGLVVLVTLWLLNAFGLITLWLHLPFPWLTSPLF